MVREAARKYPRLTSMFDDLEGPVYVSDPVSHEILYVNRAIKGIYGEVVGRICHRVFWENDDPCSFCTNDRIFGTNQGRTHTWVRRSRDGTRWFRCVDKAVPWTDGRMVRCELAIDITDQKRAENDISRIFDLSQDMICILSTDGHARRVNPAFEKTLGFTTRELMSRPYMEFVHPDDHPATLSILQELCSGKTVSLFEHRLLCKDGSHRWVAWTAAPIAEEGLFYGVARDVTGKRVLEEELRQSEDLYRTIIGTAGSAIIVVEEDRTLTFVNDEFVRFSGYSRVELIGKMAWSDFFRGNDLARMEEYHRLRRVDPSLAPRNYEATLVDRHENAKPVLVTVSMIPGTKRSVGAFLDISELKTTEKALVEAMRSLEEQNKKLVTLDKLKDGVIRDVTHELKTPVAKMSMQHEILQDALRDRGLAEELEGPLRTMETAIRRLGTTVRNILELSRLQSGGRRPRLQRVDLGRTLTDIIEDNAYALDATHLEVSTDLEPMQVTSDGEMLWHVFSNVLHNAIKFRKEDSPGKVLVSLAGVDGTAVVTIKDEGIGMTPEEVERAFERFYQVSPSIDGCGVGLSICRMIVEELGGLIRIESEGLGLGTTATITLPLT